MLDTFYWGGTITTYHALSMGTPVVALSSPSLERQFAYTYYQEMGLKECVANNPQEYVDIALRLGTDSSYRQQIQAQLLATNRRAVSKGQNTIQELEQFWITVT
jgi:predicted O-linked N-acetylglucosamine transferase (SPINDLY family)